MADKRPALTDEQIRSALRELTKQLMDYGADARVLEVLLLQKGLVKVSLEMKDQIEKITDATRRGPTGGIQ
jgi:hypothetical protein